MRSSSATALRIVRNVTKTSENRTRKRLATGSGFILIAGGLGLTVAGGGRPSRPAIGLIGAGSLLLLMNSSMMSPRAVSGLVLGGTSAMLFTIQLKDREERELQQIFMQGRELLNFPPSVRFDDDGHAVTKPHYEVLVGFPQCALEGKKEQIKVRIEGYSIRPDGNLESYIGYAYASRNGPWEHYQIERVDSS